MQVFYELHRFCTLHDAGTSLLSSSIIFIVHPTAVHARAKNNFLKNIQIMKIMVEQGGE